MDNSKEQLVREITEIIMSSDKNIECRAILKEVLKNCSNETRNFVSQHKEEYLKLLKLHGRYIR